MRSYASISRAGPSRSSERHAHKRAKVVSMLAGKLDGGCAGILTIRRLGSAHDAGEDREGLQLATVFQMAEDFVDELAAKRSSSPWRVIRHGSCVRLLVFVHR